MSISWDDDTKSTDKSDVDYDSEYKSDVDMRMVDGCDALYSVYLDGEVGMEQDGDDEAEEYEEEEDEVKEDEREEEEDENEDENEDDGKEPRMIGQGEFANSSADNVDTMEDDQLILQPEQSQKLREHTLRPQLPVHAPSPQTPQHRLWPWTPLTHPVTGIEVWRHVTPEEPHPAVPTL